MRFEANQWTLARSGLALVALVSTVLSGAAVPVAAAGPAVVTTRDDAKLGTFLADVRGVTLYMFTKDVTGISNCYDECAKAWPPVMTDGNAIGPDGLAGVLGATRRKDGGMQVTYNGMPLYYWFKDAQPGDTTGQNVGGVWFVINPTSAPTVNLRQDDQLGNILTDASGMTLYMFTKDEPNVSNCYADCATAWPPVMSADAPTGPNDVTAGLGLTPRKDGSQQVTYNGMPLYYWFKDANPGDTTGQDVGGVWYVVNP
jgi:predicted lipoprotein with Yx(FWY)xxD motif